MNKTLCPHEKPICEDRIEEINKLIEVIDKDNCNDCSSWKRAVKSGLQIAKTIIEGESAENFLKKHKNNIRLLG